MDYTSLPAENVVVAVAKALQERNIEPIVVNTKEEALAKIKEFIPKGVSVMNGSSKTLQEIGFIDYLKSGEHGWNNLHEGIVAEKDPVKQAELRKHAIFSDYYLGSVHALAATGEFVVASASGSQLPHMVFTSPNLIFVVSTQKIVPTLADAIERVEKYVFPLENERMKSVGFPGSIMAKQFIFKQEPTFSGRKLKMILVKEKLGF